MTKQYVKYAAPLVLTLALPLLGGASGDGCSANSRSPAPDVTGTWDVAYDDLLDVEIRIGGAIYNAQLAARGGEFTVDHNGNPLTFDLDCARPEVLCPSEAWPAEIQAEQRNDKFEHRMIVTLPTQRCSGALIEPEPHECGAGTVNPDCEEVCDSAVITENKERFGVIGESGDTFRLYLGAGVVSNGINCALLGISLADASLRNTGKAADGNWEAVAMEAGLVTVGFAGGCLWAGDPDMDGELEALVIAASVKLTTGFTAEKR